MVIKETHIFTRIIQELMPDDEYRKLQEALVENPKSGDVIQGSGGLRKIRWKLPAKGKRGGARVIYYHLDKDNQIYMIYAYKKNEQSDLTKEQLKQLKLVVEEELGK
jgi:mRNA-degrading endonuclease RelE of RelBE toxin-antitoxin system